MGRRESVISAIKGIIEIINKNAKEGITTKWGENDTQESWSKKRGTYWDRWDEVESLMNKAHHAYCKQYIEGLIDSNLTRVLYPKNPHGDNFIEGTLIGYLDGYDVQILSPKGGKVRRKIARVITEDLMNKTYKNGWDALDDWLSNKNTRVSKNFYSVVRKAYDNNKIPRTWQKYA